MTMLGERPKTDDGTAIPAAAPEIVRKWIDRVVAVCRPDRVVWLDGSAAEKQRLLDQAVAEGVLATSWSSRSNSPSSRWARTTPP